MLNGEDEWYLFLEDFKKSAENHTRALLDELNPWADASVLRLIEMCNQVACLLWVQPRSAASFLGQLYEYLCGFSIVCDEDVRVCLASGRRKHGIHYTPDKLASAVAPACLEPLVCLPTTRKLSRHHTHHRPPEEILALRVCDPAVGCGALLLAAGRFLTAHLVRAWSEYGESGLAYHAAGDRHELAGRLVASTCLVGVDIDPLAVELCKLGIWMGLGCGQADYHDLDRQFKVGDSLLGLPMDCDSFTPAHELDTRFDWPVEFPSVFQRAGFDAVVSNPPFGNAIERATGLDAEFKAYAKQHFGVFAQGATDRCLLFWSRALRHLLRPGGHYGLIGPTALLSHTGAWQQWMTVHAGPTDFLLFGPSAFSNARVRVTAVCGRLGRSSTIRVTNYEARNKPAEFVARWPPHLCSWNEVASSWGRRLTSDEAPCRALGQLPIVLHAGCTTSTAYELSGQVRDSRDGQGLWLVTTGLLDRYRCKWGYQPVRFLGRAYDAPRWPQDAGYTTAPTRALHRQRGPKLLLGGLTRVLECWFDELGQAAGVVSTWVIRSQNRDCIGGLYALLAIVNSATFSRLYMTRYGARAMNGQQTTIAKQALLDMPVPVRLSTMFTTQDDEAISLDAHSAQLLRACETTGRLLQSTPRHHPTYALMDRAAHLTAARLYGLSDREALQDYVWWCGKAGMMPHPAATEDADAWLSIAMHTRQYNRGIYAACDRA
jgi:hypothetical protein